MKIILLPSIMVLVWVLNHNIRKNNGSDSDNIHSYLTREDRANAIRRKDISELPYIQVPIDMFPFHITLNDEKKQTKIAEYEKIIRTLSGQRMLNLIGVSNTELKEQYGPANLEILTVYDQNYSRYLRTLQLFAECIYEEYPADAISILEYCISIGTDISGTYELLGRYYLARDDSEHFLALYDRIPVKDSISGKVIQNKLNQMKEYTDRTDNA
ncbi:MAG: hypothetical protein IJ801_06775 [Lachnospiraceae bacterium]|nr:hypothetical protein [Lachnospiraceae bacterium]